MKWYKTNSRQTEKSRIQPLTKNKNKNLNRLYKKPEEEKDQNVKNIQVTQKSQERRKKKEKKSEGANRKQAQDDPYNQTLSVITLEVKGEIIKLGLFRKDPTICCQ